MPNRWPPVMSTDVIRSGLSRRNLLGSAVLLPVAVTMLAAKGHAQTARPRPTNGHTHVILIDRMVFAPAPRNIKVGDTVTWTNRDLVRHTATARNGAFNVDLPAGASASAVMAKAGRLDYFCRYHPAMQSQLTVAA